MNNKGAAGAGDDRKNKLEWSVFALSLLLVLTILGYLIYQIYTQKEETPDVYAETWHDPSDHSPYRYHVLVHNRGGQTAESVTVEVTMKSGGQELEKAELQLAFVPKESKREGWVNFSKNPALADTVEAHIVSYNKP